MLKINESTEFGLPPLVKNKPGALPTTLKESQQLLTDTLTARIEWCENILTAYGFSIEEISQIWTWFGKGYQTSLPNILWQEIQGSKKGVDKKMSKDLQKELLWGYLQEKSQQKNKKNKHMFDNLDEIKKYYLSYL